MRRLSSLLLIACLLVPACAGRPATPPVPSEPPYALILVSLDGFRWDYLDRPEAVHLRELAARGVRAQALIPSFPSKTFPNHYTIVTGLYPGDHGIVANTMYDPGSDAWFRMSDAAAVTDGRWWGGEPLWVTAEKQGQHAATMFWPGSEATIEGVVPSRTRAYDGRVSNSARVKQVLDWLDLPAPEHPTFLTLYMSDVDGAGHSHGPDSPQVDSAIGRVDAAVGLLVDGLKARGVLGRTDLVIVSDHGMAATSADRLVVLDDYIDPRTVDVIDWSPVLAIRPHPGMADSVYRGLSRAGHMQVWRKAELPERFHYWDNPRVAPIIGLADEGWSITTRQQATTSPGRFNGGSHGFDPALASMHGILVAAGPDFRSGVEVPPVANIHLYDLMAHVLGLTPAQNDGSLDSVKVMLRGSE